MARTAIRNSILAFSGTAAYLATVVVFDLGCTSPSDSDNSPVASVVVSPASGTVQVGRTIQLTAQTLKAGGQEVTGRHVTWHAVSNLVSVSDNGLVTGLAEGGPVTITAISEGVTGTAQVTVSRAAVASVTVTGSATVKRNYFTPLTAVVKDAQGNVLLNRQVIWSAPANGPATVDATGLVEGEYEGTATITATSEGVSATFQVTVQPNPVATIAISPASASLNITESRTLTATLRDAAGLIVTGRTIQWISLDPPIVSVQAGAETASVTGVAEGGPVTITATSEGQVAAAHITVVRIANAARLLGKVIDFTTGQPLVGATLTFQIDGANRGTATSTTGGNFSSPGLPGSSTGIWILANYSGYAQTTILIPNVPAGVDTHAGSIPLVPNSSAPGSITGTIRDARTAQPIPNASVSVSSWLNSTPVSTISNSSGIFTFSGLAAGTYQLSATAAAYQVATRTGVSVGNGTTTSGQDLVLSPTGSTDIRIVLTWGNLPADLDSHLTGPNADGTRFHVYYGARGAYTVAPFAGLDVDDTSGSGPETISITQMGSGNYRYSIHDFTNRNSSTSSALGNSGASVTVYFPNRQPAQYFVPNQPGTLWTVFELSGTPANPVVVDRQMMSFTSDPAGILSPPIAGPTTETDMELIRRALGLHPKSPR